MTLLLGAIADDYTGGSDLAGMLREEGVRTVQLFGVPNDTELDRIRNRYEAVVLSLKSRSIAPRDACEQSLAALAALRTLAPRQIQFKYCSTFDSTVQGNIGPVTGALLDAMGETATIAVPALPVNGRTQYRGHLFVGSQLLSESPMRHHPLNPMTESNLVRHLQAQTQRRVGLIDWHTVQRGVEAIRNDVGKFEILLVDVLADSDLDRIAEAFVELPLITGGSGIGMALPRVWRDLGWISGKTTAWREAAASGGTLILAGSCSAATLAQLAAFEGTGHAITAVDLRQLMANFDMEVSRLSEVARRGIAREGLALVTSSQEPTNRNASEQLAATIERCFGAIAKQLVTDLLVTRIIVAGGETSGAVVSALGIRSVEITGAIDPGVPGLKALTEPPLWLALKSGNFGAPDFFQKAMRYWDEPIV